MFNYLSLHNSWENLQNPFLAFSKLKGYKLSHLSPYKIKNSLGWFVNLLFYQLSETFCLEKNLRIKSTVYSVVSNYQQYVRLESSKTTYLGCEIQVCMAHGKQITVQNNAGQNGK